MGSNKLTVIIYSTGTSREFLWTRLAVDREALRFGTIYPGGLYSTCSFFIPYNMSKPVPAIATYRIEVRDLNKTLWEGQIDVVSPVKGTNRDGYNIECTGYWGAALERKTWDKVWVDDRISNEYWEIQENNNWDAFSVNRNEVLRFSPQSGTFSTGFRIKTQYEMRGTHYIDRVTGNYNLQEGSGTWSLSLYDSTKGSTFWTVSTSGTGSFSGTPSGTCEIVTSIYQAADTNVMSSAGGTTVFAELSNIKVWGVSDGTITPSVIYGDIVAEFSDILNSDTSHIASNTYSVCPAYFDPGETVTQFIDRINKIGDASYNAWSVGLLASTAAQTPNGKPVLYAEAIPSTSSYDYAVDLREIEGGLSLDRLFGEIYNWIYVEYDYQQGKKGYWSPNSDATLKNQASIDAYGQRQIKLSLPTSSSTDALNYARRFLADHKDPKWQMASPMRLKGVVRNSSGNKVPVSWIRAGERIMVENFLQEIGGEGITFLISKTSYDEDRDVMTVSTGDPDPLAVIAYRMRIK